MRNRTLDCLLNNKPDLEQVKGFFIEHWGIIRLLNIGNYIAVGDMGALAPTKEELMAFWLLGASRVLEQSTGEVANTVEEAWAAVQFLMEDTLPDDVEINQPVINVKFSKPLSPDE